MGNTTNTDVKPKSNDPMQSLVSRCKEVAEFDHIDEGQYLHELLSATRHALDYAQRFLERGRSFDWVESYQQLLACTDDLMTAVADDIRAIVTQGHRDRSMDLDGFDHLKQFDPNELDLIFIFGNLHLVCRYGHRGGDKTDLPFSTAFGLDPEFHEIHPDRKRALLDSLLTDISIIKEIADLNRTSKGLAAFTRLSALNPDQWDILYLMHEVSNMGPGRKAEMVLEDHWPSTVR